MFAIALLLLPAHTIQSQNTQYITYIWILVGSHSDTFYIQSLCAPSIWSAHFFFFFPANGKTETCSLARMLRGDLLSCLCTCSSISSLFHGVSKLEFMVADSVRSKQTETHRQDRRPEGMWGFLQAQRHDWQAPPMTSHGMLLWLSPAILDLL